VTSVTDADGAAVAVGNAESAIVPSQDDLIADCEGPPGDNELRA
jgi:hypothetical protein